MEVLPNGNLLIEGQRALSVMGEDMQYIHRHCAAAGYLPRQHHPLHGNRGFERAIHKHRPNYQDTEKGIFDSLVDFINPF